MHLYERLGCRDYARFDFRTDGRGEIKLLDVNPNPGWCWDGKLNTMAGFAGLRYSELLRRILVAATARLSIGVAAHRHKGSQPQLVHLTLVPDEPCAGRW
jgi:hypothetical protein